MGMVGILKPLNSMNQQREKSNIANLSPSSNSNLKPRQSHRFSRVLGKGKIRDQIIQIKSAENNRRDNRIKNKQIVNHGNIS